jgi:MoaA/NifB/PqqE/SkfB family radical SAM enzyme
MSCLHCCNSCRPGKGKHMALETALRALSLNAGYGGYVTIGGGEPTLHPEFRRVLIEAIAAQEDEGTVHVITNGSIEKEALFLAKLARSQVIGAELSWDQWHDRRLVSDRVEKAFKAMKAIRDVDYNLVPQGRAKKEHIGDHKREMDCVCSDLVVTPDGTIRRCGCTNAKRYGNVNDANGADFFAKALEEINEYECEKLWRKASKQEKESKKTAA